MSPKKVVTVVKYASKPVSHSQSLEKARTSKLLLLPEDEDLEDEDLEDEDLEDEEVEVSKLAKKVKKVEKVVPAKTTISVPEGKFAELRSEVLALGKQVVYLQGIVGRFQKMLALVATFESNALTTTPKPSENGRVEKSTTTLSGKPKKIYSDEERAAIRVRFLKGQAKAQARRDLGDKFTEARFEKFWAKTHPE